MEGESQLKLVVLDGYTLNPGDLSWDALHTFGDLTVYDRTAPDEVIDRAKDAQLIFTNKTPLTKETLAQLPNLKYIGVLATGYNIVDIEAARELGITVTNVPTYSTQSVAQFVFALILALIHRVELHSDAVHRGEWSNSRDFCFTLSPLSDLENKTLGIIGYGRIGERVAQIAKAFGMHVLVAESRSNSKDSSVPRVSWERLFVESDFISLHTPLTADTKGMINADVLKLMKPSAYLINTGRGPLIEEQDLADTLRQGIIAGAALDVLSVEPPPKDNPLLTAPNCIITPHIAWATLEARKRLMDITVENVRSFLDGNTINAVN